MKNGTRVWTCDGCGKRETWRKGWSYTPCVVSLTNDGGTNEKGERLWLPLVSCSEACAVATTCTSKRPLSASTA